MDDRELLEAAARAAGIDLRWIEAWGSYFIHEPHKLPISWKAWNPLHNDADALRLAVSLMGVEPYKSRGYLPCIQADAKATRHAIVRAAAEIGKEIK